MYSGSLSAILFNSIKCHPASLIEILKVAYICNSDEILQRIQYEWLFQIRKDLLTPNGVGSSDPAQYSCLENSMVRGAWQAIVQGVAKSWTWGLRDWTHTHTHTYIHRHTHIHIHTQTHTDTHTHTHTHTYTLTPNMLLSKVWVEIKPLFYFSVTRWLDNL